MCPPTWRHALPCHRPMPRVRRGRILRPALAGPCPPPTLQHPCWHPRPRAWPSCHPTQPSSTVRAHEFGLGQSPPARHYYFFAAFQPRVLVAPPTSTALTSHKFPLVKQRETNWKTSSSSTGVLVLRIFLPFPSIGFGCEQPLLSCWCLTAAAQLLWTTRCGLEQTHRGFGWKMLG